MEKKEKTKILRQLAIIDASESTVGRMASRAAMLLIGKNKPGYRPHIDGGANVVVVNSGQAHFSGKKNSQKVYRHHSMHPGGLKEIPAKKLLQEKPEEVIRHAISKMLPRNKFHSHRMKRLTIK